LSREGEVVIARRTWANGVVLERRFQLAKDHDYVFQVEQTLKNPTPQGVVWPAYQVNVGTAQPLHVHDQTLYIKSGWLEAANEHFHVTTLHDFEPGGFFFGMFGAHAPRTTIAGEQTGLQWVSVKNQFFTLILTPLGQPLLEKVESHKVALARQNRLAPFGLQAVAGLPAETLAAGAEVKQNFQLYAGPKEYARLKGLPHREDVVMEFGFWSWVVKPLLATLNQLHRWVPNYGWVIILLTLGIKMTLWPLQGIANRNMKQMQALAPKMKELQERHKDAPEKLNKDMMKLYQEYGVNPMGGCLPMLIQMPIFLGFYTMLQSAVELRNASFFWIHDLSQPDTIAHLPLLGSTLDINPLPLIMSATTMLLMRMSPQSSDNPQMKMMQWMPLIFVFFLYNFASALSLYWTVNNLISIGQTYYNLRQPLPVLKKVAKK
jgi:YidC/Oxa1 family membrane protein insertase